MVRHRHLLSPVAVFVLASLGVCTANAQDQPWTCRYENPYSKVPECRAYLGTWTEVNAKGACDTVFTGVSGDFGTAACVDEGAIGVCVGPEQDGGWTKVWFYGGDPKVTADLCGSFLHGTWEAGSGQGTPTGETRPATEEAIAAMASSERVEVTPNCADEACLKRLVDERKGITFSPRDGAEASFILYPGTLIDPRAYAPVAHAIAGHGVRVVVVPMPNDLALNGWDRASDIISSTQEPTRWFLGGHSMGGAMAVHFVHESATPIVEGLILWGAYADEKDDIRTTTLPVLSLQGSRDGVSTPEEIESHRPFLPPTGLFLSLEGGNHAQFGTYGAQDGDQAPLITAVEQLDQVAGATVHFVSSTLHGRKPLHSVYAQLPPHQSDWCGRMQIVAANLEAPLRDDEMVIEDILDVQAFGAAKPAIGSDGVLTLQGRVSTGGNAALLDAPPLVAKQIWCKAKSQHAVAEALGRPVAGDAGTCAQLNRATLTWATDQLPATERAAYDARGIEVQFLDDIDYATGVDWLMGDGVKLSSTLPKTFSITSDRLLVGDRQDLPEATREVMYCKLWAPESALLWVLSQSRAGTDALTEPADEGCGCLVGRRSSAPPWFASSCLLLGLAALLRRRRMRRWLHGESASAC
ncbi:MAG: alpha/beta hydrolase [Polyangiaceae bacterium]|nr:alpha/beta hydrolase [Polyangiaceae bacterium]